MTFFGFPRGLRTDVSPERSDQPYPVPGRPSSSTVTFDPSGTMNVLPLSSLVRTTVFGFLGEADTAPGIPENTIKQPSATERKKLRDGILDSSGLMSTRFQPTERKPSRQRKSIRKKYFYSK
jgi:hypothetical protein